MAIQQRIVGVYGIIWINLPEKESCCTILVGSVDRPLLGLKARFLQDPLWELSILFLRRLAEEDRARLE